MMNIKFILGITFQLFISYSLFAQKTLYVPTRSLEGRVLIKIDSLGYKDNLKVSPFYIDSIDLKPYSGKAVTFYGEVALDSFDIINGYLNGWKKSYTKTGSKFVLNHMEYNNQEKFIHITCPHYLDERNRRSYIRFFVKSKYYYYSITYKSNKKIIVNQMIRNYERIIIKNKIKIKSIEDLNLFFKTEEYKLVYPYCKRAGIFGL